MNIPTGFTTVTPYIFIEEVENFLTFLIRAFNAKEIGRTTRPDGVIANLQVSIGSSVIMISEANTQYCSMPTAFYIYVTNAEKSMSQAIDAGAMLEMEVAVMPYNDKQGGVKDKFGNIWWISERLVDEPYH